MGSAGRAGMDETVEFASFYQLPAWSGQAPVQRYRDTLDQIALADRVGLDAVWLAELHFQPDYSVMPAPLLVAAAATQRTERIRLGVGVNLLPLHDPLHLAEQIAALDVLSEGRVLCGVGRGGNPAHFAGYGIDMASRTERFEEAAQVLHGAWADAPLTFAGRHFRYDAVNVVPKPVQRPGPPLWVATNSEQTIEAAARAQRPILVSTVTHPAAVVAERVQRYRRLRQETGHPAGDHDVGLMFPLHVAADGATARAEAEDSIISYLRMAGRDLGGAYRSRGEEPPARLRRYSDAGYDVVTDDMGAIGDPAEVADRLRALAGEIGAGHLAGWFNTGGLIPHDRVRASMRLFAEEVIPRLR